MLCQINEYNRYILDTIFPTLTNIFLLNTRGVGFILQKLHVLKITIDIFAVCNATDLIFTNLDTISVNSIPGTTASQMGWIYKCRTITLITVTMAGFPWRKNNKNHNTLSIVVRS